MKKGFLFIIVAGLISAVLIAQEYDIRKLKWWMSYEQVATAEGLGSSLFKEDQLLGAQVEVIFGLNKKGLYSVSYTTEDALFARNVIPKLDAKYGPGKTDLDYTFLMTQAHQILTKSPKAVLNILDRQNYQDIDSLDISYDEKVNIKKMLKSGLTPHRFWEGDTTAALLVVNDNQTILSYRPKSFHYENKKAFEALIATFRKDTAEAQKKNASDENI